MIKDNREVWKKTIGQACVRQEVRKKNSNKQEPILPSPIY